MTTATSVRIRSNPSMRSSHRGQDAARVTAASVLQAILWNTRCHRLSFGKGRVLTTVISVMSRDRVGIVADRQRADRRARRRHRRPQPDDAARLVHADPARDLPGRVRRPTTCARALDEPGLDVIVREVTEALPPEPEAPSGEEYVLAVRGPDRVGLLADVDAHLRRARAEHPRPLDAEERRPVPDAPAARREPRRSRSTGCGPRSRPPAPPTGSRSRCSTTTSSGPRTRSGRERVIRSDQILSTVAMIQEEKLDVRAVTLGVSLLECRGATPRATADAVRARLQQVAGPLVGRLRGGERPLRRADHQQAARRHPGRAHRSRLRPDDFVVLAHALDDGGGRARRRPRRRLLGEPRERHLAAGGGLDRVAARGARRDAARVRLGAGRHDAARAQHGCRRAARRGGRARRRAHGRAGRLRGGQARRVHEPARRQPVHGGRDPRRSASPMR